jgi:hypothetical protein
MFDNCWSYDNGGVTGGVNGDGNGFKLGYMYVVSTISLHLDVRYCISAHNAGTGFDMNDNNGSPPRYMQNSHIYNNFAYHNGDYPTFNPSFYIGYGYTAWSGDETYSPQRIFRNNAGYDNQGVYGNDTYHSFGGTTTSQNNSWDGVVTCNAADFVSLDYSQLKGARQADGSLPVITFGHLASTSDLIDAGTTLTGLTYEGIAPDLGAFEYSEPEVPIDPVVIYTNSVTAGTTSATTGGNVIDDGGGTVSERGVAYGSSANPTIAGSHTSDGAGTGTFISNISGLTAATTYHVRAYATNEAGTAYGADVPFTTTSQTGLSGDFVFSGGKPVYLNGKIIVK